MSGISFDTPDDLETMKTLITEHIHGKGIPNESIQFEIYSDKLILYLPIEGLARRRDVTHAVFKSGYHKYLAYRTHPHSMQHYNGRRRIGPRYEFTIVSEFKELLGQHYLLNEKTPPTQLRLQFKSAENKMEKLLQKTENHPLHHINSTKTPPKCTPPRPTYH